MLQVVLPNIPENPLITPFSVEFTSHVEDAGDVIVVMQLGRSGHYYYPELARYRKFPGVFYFKNNFKIPKTTHLFVVFMSASNKLSLVSELKYIKLRVPCRELPRRTQKEADDLNREICKNFTIVRKPDILICAKLRNQIPLF